MFGKKILASALCGTAMLLSAGSHADVIYQSIPDLTVAPSDNAYCSECYGNGQQLGQQFTLSAGASVGSALFALDNGYFWPASVTLSIYADGGNNTLGTQVYNQTYSSFAYDSDTGNGTDVVGVNTPGLTLGAGTYDLFLGNSYNLGVPGYYGMGSGDQIYVEGVSGGAPTAGSTYYFVGSNDAALLLQGNSFDPVPEPATYALAGLGLLALAMVRRKTARQ